jgi:hypothetical protein
VGGVTTQSAAAACDALLQACLERGTVDNISVVLVVLGPPSAPSVTVQASVKGTPAPAGQSGSVHDSTPIAAQSSSATPLSRQPASQVRPAAAHPPNSARSASRAAADEADVDMPIFQVQRPTTGSLHEVFTAVADDSAYTASPLNTAAGSHRVKKQLNFNDT